MLITQPGLELWVDQIWPAGQRRKLEQPDQPPATPASAPWGPYRGHTHTVPTSQRSTPPHPHPDPGANLGGASLGTSRAAAAAQHDSTTTPNAAAWIRMKGVCRRAARRRQTHAQPDPPKSRPPGGSGHPRRFAACVPGQRGPEGTVQRRQWLMQHPDPAPSRGVGWGATSAGRQRQLGGGRHRWSVADQGR